MPMCASHAPGFHNSCIRTLLQYQTNSSATGEEANCTCSKNLLTIVIYPATVGSQTEEKNTI